MSSLFSKQSLKVGAVIQALAITVFLMILEKQKPSVVTPLRDAAHAAISPINSFAERLRFTNHALGVAAQSKQQLHRENLALKAKLAQANLYLQKYAELSAQNARLRGLYTVPAPVDGRVEIAQVIGIDSNPLRQILVLNRGTNQGVYVGQTVLDEAGLMGQVINAYANSSRAMLLSDTQHAISVRVLRTGLRAVAMGNGDSTSLDLRYVPSTADIEVGDKLVSTGLGKRFPSGYAIGEISFIDREHQFDFVKARIKPSANLADATYALLMQPSSPIQLKAKPDPENDVIFQDDVLLEADFATDHQSNTVGITIPSQEQIDSGLVHTHDGRIHHGRH